MKHVWKWLLVVIALSAVLFLNGGFGVVTGKGEMIGEDIPASSYTKVRLEGAAELIYSNQDAGSIHVEMQQNLLDVFSATVEDGTLVMKWTKSVTTFGSTELPKIYISTPTLESVSLSGAVSLKSQDAVEGESLTIHAAGASSVDIIVDVKELSAQGAGSSHLTFAGACERLDINMSGSGKITAVDLQTQDATIVMTGACSGQISCSGTLDVSISGAGSLQYKGNPNVTKSIAGAGSVSQMQ